MVPSIVKPSASVDVDIELGSGAEPARTASGGGAMPALVGRTATPSMIPDTQIARARQKSCFGGEREAISLRTEPPRSRRLRRLPQPPSTYLCAPESR